MLTTIGTTGLLADKTGATPPAVIALHGWMRTGGDFADIVAGLDAVAIHLPGMGVTPEPAAAWGSPEYADDVADAIRPFAPVVLVGHSYGGRVAVNLAAKYPDLVSGLVLTGVPLVRLKAAPKPKLGFRVIRSLVRAKLLKPAVLERQRRRYGSADYLAAQGVMRDILVTAVAENYDEALARITAPVSMVWGELDTSAPADAGLAASKKIPNAKFRVVPGAGHLMDGDLRTAVREELHKMIAEVAK